MLVATVCEAIFGVPALSGCIVLAGKYGLFHTTARKKKEDKEYGYPLQDHKEPEQANTDLDLLIDEYNSFHGKWVARLQLFKADLKEGINGNTNI